MNARDREVLSCLKAGKLYNADDIVTICGKKGLKISAAEAEEVLYSLSKQAYAIRFPDGHRHLGTAYKVVP